MLPWDDGKLYHKYVEPDWYYSLKVCKNLYKTGDGCVKVYSKKTGDWEGCSLYYSYISNFGNYESISKEEADELLKIIK